MEVRRPADVGHVRGSAEPGSLGRFTFDVEDVLDGPYSMRIDLRPARDLRIFASSREQAIAAAAELTRGEAPAAAIWRDSRGEYRATTLYGYAADARERWGSSPTLLPQVHLESAQLRSDRDPAGDIARVRFEARNPAVLALVDGDYVHRFRG